MSRIAWIHGPLDGDLKEFLLGIPDCHAQPFHHIVMVGLQKMGFKTRREVVVPDRGDGKRGKIDLVAERNGNTVAIELDCDRPRKKSLCKLKSYPATTRIVVCRSNEPSNRKRAVVGSETLGVIMLLLGRIKRLESLLQGHGILTNA